MTLKRALAIALTVAAALPASAAAQQPVTPPDADNYLGPYFFNNGNPVRTGDELGIAADTTSYTVQGDMYNPPGEGGPPEPTFCLINPTSGQGSQYGNTIWAVFKAGDYGVLSLDAVSGTFDEVIRVVPIQSPEHP